MIVRDFGNGYNVVDWTEEVNTIPNQWGLIGQLGIFSTEKLELHVAVIEEIIKDGALWRSFKPRARRFAQDAHLYGSSLPV